MNFFTINPFVCKKIKLLTFDYKLTAKLSKTRAMMLTFAEEKYRINCNIYDNYTINTINFVNNQVLLPISHCQFYCHYK